LTLGGGHDPAVRSLSLGYAALVTGLLVELVRVTGSATTVIVMAGMALAASAFAFLPFRGEGAYVLQNHVDIWPIVFAGALLLMAAVHLRKQLIQRLDEGTTLLHSMVFFYWMLDAFAHRSGHAIAIVVAAVPLAGAALFAWTPLPLSRPARLALSLWSSLVLLGLALQSAYGLARAGSVEAFFAARDIEGGWDTLLSYFLLGTSSAYIATNLTMLAGYLPGRGTFFNAAYFRSVRELSDQHIARFSPGQVDPSMATAVAAGVCIFFAIHWVLRPFPTPVALWLVLTAVPWALYARTAWRSRASAGA
jgi:hypothetical protein